MPIDNLDTSTLNGIVAIIAVLIIIWFVRSLIRVLPDYERLVILRLGSFGGVRGGGLTFVIPVLEQGFKVDMREKFLEIPAQTAITRDNAPISIDFFVYYRIVDPRLAVLNVDNVVRASLNIATTTLRAVIGDIDLDDVLSKRENINDSLRVKLDETTERWGMKITSVEIREIEPPKDVQAAMNRQMSAERERRALVTQASGEREAAIAVAEGEKQSAILKAQGEREAAILRAEGERQAQLLRAQGFAAALTTIYEQAKSLDANTMALQYMDMLEKIGSSPATKFVLPMELTGMINQLVSSMNNNKSSNNNS